MKTVYYFTADWCQPCKRTRPIVEELNREQTIAKFQFIDADNEIDMVHNFNVRSIPTFILVEDGQETKRITGAQTKENLEALINGL